MTPVKILRPSNSPIRLTKAEYGFEFLIREHLSDHSWKDNYYLIGNLHKRLIYAMFVLLGVDDQGHVPPGAEMAAAVVKKAVIVNVRATAHDRLRDHPCYPRHGRQRGSEEEEDHDHVPPDAEMTAAGVKKVVIVNVRGTAHDHLHDHPCHPLHGRQRGSEEEEDHGHLRPDAEMIAAVVKKAVIAKVRATAHDHLRDHPCHPLHGQQRWSKEEEDHGHVPPGAEIEQLE